MLRDGRDTDLDRDDGAAAVEFALVCIPLLLVVFGIINYGIVFSQQLSLNSAARDSARSAVVQPVSGTGLTCTQVVSAARSAVTGLAMSGSKVGVTVIQPNGAAMCASAAGSASITGTSPSGTPCTGSGTANTPLQVQLTFDSNTLVPLIPPSTFNLKANGQFTCEYT